MSKTYIPATNSQELLKQLLTLAIPIAIGGAVQTSYHVINAFWVGRLGAEAVAVVSICMPVNLLLISLGSGLSLAGSILISQNFGAGQKQQVDHVAAQALTLIGLVAVVLSACGYLAAPRILQVMGAGENIFDDAVTYLRISFASSIFLLLSSLYQAILRGLGEARAPLRIIMASVAINALLDPLFIFGWGIVPALGVIGAAFATLITQLITTIAGIRLMLQPRFGLTVKAKDLLPDWPMLGQLLRLGFPSSIEQTMQALTVSVVTILAAKFGTLALAAYGIAFRILTFVIMPVFSISMAASILVGQSTGAGDLNQATRIARVSATAGFAIMAIIGSVFFFAAVPIISFFVPNDPELIERGALVLRIYALGFPLTGIQLALTGTFRGAGDTFSTMVLTLLGIWLVQIPLAYVLSQHTAMGELGLWWSSFFSGIITVTMTLLYYKSHRWQRKRLVKA